MVHRTLPAAVAAALALAAAPAAAHDPDRSPKGPAGLGHVHADPAPTKDPSRIALNPTQDPTTSAAVTWRTDAAITEGRVEVVPRSGGTVRTVEATAGAPVTFAGWTYMSRHHSATIDGLEPATRYRYRVGLEGAWSAWRELRTASDDPGEPWDLLYFGDAQNDVERSWTPVVERAFRTVPDALVHLHAGDLINTASNDDEWRQWFGALGERVSTVSTVAALGNHEDTGDAQATQFREHFTFPLNGPASQSERAYFTDVQDARIITLNSNLSFDDPIGALSQTLFLDEALRTSDRRWNVVTSHHPLFSASEGRDNPHLRLLWLDVLERHDVDLVLQGHDHACSRGHLVADEDAEGRNTGPVYVVSVSGPKYYELSPDGDNNWTQNGARRVAGHQHTSTFQHLRFEADRVTYRSIVAAKGSAPTTDASSPARSSTPSRPRRTPTARRSSPRGPDRRCACEHAFVSIKGSPYARFQRALQLGDLALVHVAAAELPRIDLDDALSICRLMARDQEPSFERAAVRWTARLCLEHPAAGIAEARVALALFDTMPADPDGAAAALARLRERLRRAA